MNRIIKFRVYDIKKRKMFTVSELSFRSEGVFVYYTTPTAVQWGSNEIYKIRNLANDAPAFGRKADCVLMQFTGLKDKNGKEIYEGDIVLDDGGFKQKVVWRDDFACFALRHLDDVGGTLSIDSVEQVIGNIYENPELLELK